MLYRLKIGDSWYQSHNQLMTYAKFELVVIGNMYEFDNLVSQEKQQIHHACM